MFDFTVHVDTVLLAAGFALGGWRMAISFRDQFRALHQTVYGSIEPPVEGLVKVTERHERLILKLSGGK